MSFVPEPLDPDDDRPPYEQVASSLSAAIRTRRIAPGEKLPSHKELTELYGFARATIQRALRDLEDEGLVVSRKGSGVYVRNRTERPSGLRPYVEQAFSRDEVTIDFAGFSSETLHGALQEPLDKIRVGRLTPQSITMRILVPDMSVAQAAPVRMTDGGDDQRLRDRMREIMVSYTRSIRDSFAELKHLGLVSETRIQVRVHSGTPFFKLYVVNGEDAFSGTTRSGPTRSSPKAKPSRSTTWWARTPCCSTTPSTTVNPPAGPNRCSRPACGSTACGEPSEGT